MDALLSAAFSAVLLCVVGQALLDSIRKVRESDSSFLAIGLMPRPSNRPSMLSRLVDAIRRAFKKRHRQASAAQRFRHIETILDTWAAILPVRIANEDLADYLEDICRRCDAGQSGRVYIRTLATVFWTGINAVGYAMKALGKKSLG